MPSQVTCLLCNKAIEKGDFCDICSADLVPVFANLIKKQSDQESPFTNVDNLVFQGGGVKGVAYLGVLQGLQNKNKDLLKNVKRIAGTSAGSILALYLGLNMDYDQIDKILQGDYIDLLDDGIILTVGCRYWLLWTQDKYFKVKDIFIKITDNLKILQDMMKQPDQVDQAKQDMEAFFTELFKYLAGKFGFLAKVASEAVASTIADYITRFLTGMFITQPENEAEQTSDQPQQNGSSTYLDALKGMSEKAFKEVQESQSSYQASEETSQTFGLSGVRSGDQETTDPSELVGETLAHAVGELICYVVTGHLQGSDEQHEVGLFAGDLARENLIQAPLREALKKHGIVNDDITFKELSEVIDIATKDSEAPQKAFRSFYVTSFNTATQRTDVFSADHTPNVVVADAVRASMSIPIFFQSVKIRDTSAEPDQSETAAGVIPQRKKYNEKGESLGPIQYMDGGVLDNYPIWIFDDLRFCLNREISEWKPEKKLFVQNAGTLGFKLLDKDAINLYVKPYYDEAGKKILQAGDQVNVNSFFGVLKFLVNVETDAHEENAFIQRGDYPRTVYVDNCKISAIAFKMSNDQKKMLKDSGLKAVDNYANRASNSFKDEKFY